jgi:hypothetical protein
VRAWLGGRLVAATVALLATAAIASCDDEPEYACSEAGSTALYDKRIAPILADERPRSCNQCHLAGIDLSLFVKDTPCQTMACLVASDLVDLEDPPASKILGWIGRAEPQSELITAEVIEEEYQGVLEWIEHSASCGASACPTFEDPCGQGPSDEEKAGACELSELDWVPFDDPGGCDDRTLEAMFQHDVYAFRGRCYPCHWTTEDPYEDAPRWLVIDDCDLGSLATLREVERRGLIDVDRPEESLLLDKPLSEALGGLPHGGGPKYGGFDDPGYLAARELVERYAACKAGD